MCSPRTLTPVAYVRGLVVLSTVAVFVSLKRGGGRAGVPGRPKAPVAAVPTRAAP